MSEAIRSMLNEHVVFDTGTPIIYIGTLVDVTDNTLVLIDADMHDCRLGHANPEEYVAKTHTVGIHVNRRRIVVMRTAVISISRLADIVND